MHITPALDPLQSVHLWMPLHVLPWTLYIAQY